MIHRSLQMVFQDPYSSLNPRKTIYDTLREPLLYHRVSTKNTVDTRIRSLLEEVGLPESDRNKYPHEFSGGQRQRIAIARALALEPEFLVADEPVSALDVSIQSQILNLLSTLCRKRALTMLFISHDLSVIRYLCNRIAVMYLGQIVETGNTEAVFSHPAHPYTRALISAIPRIGERHGEKQSRIILKGSPPSPVDPPSGCRFAGRCQYAQGRCRKEDPVSSQVSTDHSVSCLRLGEI